jgi:hypothetical protein
MQFVLEVINGVYQWHSGMIIAAYINISLKRRRDVTEVEILNLTHDLTESIPSCQQNKRECRTP